MFGTTHEKAEKMITLLATIMISMGQPEQVILLQEQEGKEIAVKGYLHRSPLGEQILTSAPNTPSCCLASPLKRKEQVVLQGETELFPSDHPVTVKGVLHVSSSDSSLVLVVSKVLVDQGGKRMPWVTIAFGIFVFSGILMVLGKNWGMQTSLI